MSTETPIDLRTTPSYAKLPESLRQILEAELRPDERLDWFAQPVEDMLVKRAKIKFAWGILMVPTGLAFFGWWASRLNSVAEAGFLSFCPFSAGFFLAVPGVLLIADSRQPRHIARMTLYAITNLRAIKVYVGKNGLFSLESYLPDHDDEVECALAPGDAGDILFHGNKNWRTNHDPEQVQGVFVCVPEVRKAEQLILKLPRPYYMPFSPGDPRWGTHRC
ncbi:MAG TPA: hypothetical protein VMF06_14920 [Candidatus Limnocylindria bacterium]|nr:hypothetical protein [Candidatus Limnocylindria bacterium]